MKNINILKSKLFCNILISKLLALVWLKWNASKWNRLLLSIDNIEKIIHYSGFYQPAIIYCQGIIFLFIIFFLRDFIFLFSRKLYLKNFNIKNKDNKISQGRDWKFFFEIQGNCFLKFKEIVFWNSRKFFFEIQGNCFLVRESLLIYQSQF